MALTWNVTLNPGISETAAQISELRANIDLTRVKVGLSVYSWSDSINQNYVVLNTEIAELKTALDGAYDENYCHTYCSSHLVTYHSAQYPGYCGGNYAAYYPSNPSGYNPCDGGACS